MESFLEDIQEQESFIESINEKLNQDKLSLEDALQKAINMNHCKLAKKLITIGANPNAMVDGVIDGWKQPILHQAISKTIENSRFPRREADGPKNDGILFNEHLSLLKFMFEHKGDVNAEDSYGNLPIMRAVLDAINLDLSITDEELDEDLEQIFKVLIDAGCDINQRTENRKSVFEMFRRNPVIDYIPE